MPKTGGRKPSIFIGSSSEGLSFARAIKEKLGDEAEVTIWNEGLFEVGSVTLDELRTFSYRFDFAVLVLTPDDQIVTRDISTQSPRDNVLFELGMFMSTLGADRTFVVKTDKKLKLPSDLLGLTIADLAPQKARESLKTRVERACDAIQASVEHASRKSTFGLLPSTALAVGYYVNFVEEVCSSFSDPRTRLAMTQDGQERVLKFSDLRGKKITFTVIIPTDFSDISHESLQNLKFEHSEIWDVILDTPSRDFPFYTLLREEQGDSFEFFDLPTTLHTSFEAIQYIVGKTIGTDDVIDLIRRREIENFRETIERLARDRASHKYVRTTTLEEYFQ